MEWPKDSAGNSTMEFQQFMNSLYEALGEFLAPRFDGCTPRSPGSRLVGAPVSSRVSRHGLWVPIARGCCETDIWTDSLDALAYVTLSEQVLLMAEEYDEKGVFRKANKRDEAEAARALRKRLEEEAAAAAAAAAALDAKKEEHRGKNKTNAYCQVCRDIAMGALTTRGVEASGVHAGAWVAGEVNGLGGSGDG